MGSREERAVLFHRKFREFHGGHLKIWDYYNHVESAQGFYSQIFFSKGTIWDDSNPWIKLKNQVMFSYEPERADILFMGGRDWLQLDPSLRENSEIPIINLIQNVRHARKDKPHYTFLAHRAIRICTTPEIEASIRATGKVNGPVFMIHLGIDFSGPIFEDVRDPESIDLVISALKQPDLGHELFHDVSKFDFTVELLTDLLPRDRYLEKLRRAKNAVFLPNKEEGIYLPALEAMALGTFVICPDVVGNRSLCNPDRNCFRPEYNMDQIVSAVKRAFALVEDERSLILQQARMTVKNHTLSQEREQFIRLLSSVDQIW